MQTLAYIVIGIIAGWSNGGKRHAPQNSLRKFSKNHKLAAAFFGDKNTGEKTERAFTFHVKTLRCFSDRLRRRLRSVDVLKPIPLYSRYALSHKQGRSHEEISGFYVL